MNGPITCLVEGQSLIVERMVDLDRLFQNLLSVVKDGEVAGILLDMLFLSSGKIIIGQTKIIASHLEIERLCNLLILDPQIDPIDRLPFEYIYKSFETVKGT